MTILIVNILLAVIPAVFLMIYFYRKDKKPEPAVLIWKVFIIGFFSVIPAGLIEHFIEPFTYISDPLTAIFARAFIMAALVEETTKLLVVKTFVYNKPQFDEITDGVVYAITASMGFACFENILYSSGGTAVVLVRAFTAVPLHAVASGIMGYYIGLSKFRQKKDMYAGLIYAVIIHGAYDFFLFTGTVLSFLVIPLLLICGIILKKLLNRAIQSDLFNGRS